MVGRVFYVTAFAVLMFSPSLADEEQSTDYDEDMLEAISVATVHMNMMINSLIIKGVYEVDVANREAQENGLDYRLSLVLRDTNCVKRGNHSDGNLDGCYVLDDPQTSDVACSANVFDLHLNGKKLVRSVDCRTAVREEIKFPTNVHLEGRENTNIASFISTDSNFPHKNACPGCAVQQDPSKFPMDKLQRTLATANVNEGVSKIISVSTRVVSGIEYTVVYESASGKTCTVSWVDAPWISDAPMDTEVSCRAKRSVGPCVGCPVEQDPSKFNMDKLYRTLATANVNEAVKKVISVTTQVVSGVKYTVVYESASGKTCTISWVEAPWESDAPMDTQVSCRAKRSVEPCLGCPMKQDPKTFSMDKLQRTLATANVNEGVKKILSVTTQVVAGFKYTVVYESASGKTCTVSWVEAPWKSDAPMNTHVSCRAKRSAESCPGCPVKQDPSKYMDKLKSTLATANVNEGVKRIISVTTQVVAGIEYTVVYESVSGKTCTVSWVEAPWVSKAPMGTKVSCRAKRSVNSKVCAGCPMEQDPSKFPLDKLTRTLATANFNEGVKRIVSVTSQVVAGIAYTVVYESASGKMCTVSWVEAPWESKAPLGTKISCRAKRSLGEFEDVDGSELVDVEAFGEQAVNAQSNGNRKVIVKVMKAQKKVVHGVVYKVKFLVKSTACSVEQVPEESCLEKEVAPREECDALFFSSPYLMHGSLHVETMNMECHNAVSNSFLVLPYVDGHDEKDMQTAQQFAVEDVNARVNNLFYLGLYKVASVDEQMTEGGKLYTFEIQMRDTNCIKKEVMDLEKCHLVGRADDIMCEVSVFYSPFTGLKSIRSNVCRDVPNAHGQVEN